MAYEQRDMSGSLFKNQNQRPDKNDANATGSAMIDGVEYWVNAWTKRKPDGTPWQSLSFKPKAPKQTSYDAPTINSVDDDDSIPF